MKSTKSEVELNLPRLFRLTTGFKPLVDSLIASGHKNLRNLNYIYPGDVPEYMEEFLPRLKALPVLSTLHIDTREVEDKSLGSLQLELPQVVNFLVINCQMLDEKLIITKDAVSLETLSLYDGKKKEIIIDAPHVKHIAIKWFEHVKNLTITAMTAYTLHLRSTDFFIKNCPGVGKMMIEFNPPQDEYVQEAVMKEPGFYGMLQYVQ